MMLYREGRHLSAQGEGVEAEIWNIGEPIPELEGGVVTMELDKQELVIVLRALGKFGY